MWWEESQDAEGGFSRDQILQGSLDHLRPWEFYSEHRGTPLNSSEQGATWSSVHLYGSQDQGEETCRG